MPGFFAPETILSENAAGFQQIYSNPPVIRKNGNLILGGPEDVRDNFIVSKKSFLEINVPQMQARVYRNGILKEEMPIDRTGNPKDWSGLASGLYKANSKSELVFSLENDTYLPYAVNYYGNLYLHGKPYPANSGRDVSGYVCGCRFSGLYARNIYNEVKTGMPILILDKPGDRYEYEKKKTSIFPKLLAKGYLVADLDSGHIFAERYSERKLPIASLTKLMTAVVVSEQADPQKKITVRDYMLNPYGFTNGLTAGAKYGAMQLFYPLLEQSSNDAAEILSYTLGSKRTLQLMNEKTKPILMMDTKFSDAHGLSSGNVSTAKDLFYLARYIANSHPGILDITKGNEAKANTAAVFLGGGNKNLFTGNANFIGGKTGYILESKYNGLFIFRLDTAKGQRRVAVILLGSPHWQTGYGNLKSEVKAVVNWLNLNYGS